MIKEVTHQNLTQLSNVLLQFSEAQFTQPLTIYNGSTVGMHVRHVVEFYECLLSALSTGEVNYDLRKRNQLLECLPKACLNSIQDILAKIAEVTGDVTLKLSANYSTSSSEEPITLTTTFFRELLYNIEHTVHHLAIIKMGITEMGNGIVYDENFGVASSTIRNKNVCAQ
mgnify:CR=1 FL=1